MGRELLDTASWVLSLAVSDDTAEGYGRFRAADFGDLLWNNEIELMCPDNLLGTVGLFMVTHHGVTP